MVAWTNKVVVRLIQEYKNKPILWDTTHELYRIQSAKYDAWAELAQKFGCEIADLRKKLNSLMASHRREKTKVRGGTRSSWFLYPYMNFLPSHLEIHDSENDMSDELLLIEFFEVDSTSHRAQKRKRLQVRSQLDPFNNFEDAEFIRRFRLSKELVLDLCAELSPMFKEPVKSTDIYLETKKTPEKNPPSPFEEEHLSDGIFEESDEDLQEEMIVKEEMIPDPVRFAPKVRKLIYNSRRPKSIKTIKKPLITHSQGRVDSQLLEALKTFKRSELSRKKDECDSFGEYIAISLRKHDERTQSMIKQAINNILFEQEMKKFSTPQYVVISNINDNPLNLSDNDGGDK